MGTLLYRAPGKETLMPLRAEPSSAPANIPRPAAGFGGRGRSVPLLYAAALAAGVAGPAMAQEAEAPGSALSLQEAVHTALKANVWIEAGRLQLDAAYGEVLSARGAYDLRLWTSVGGAQTDQRVFDSSGGVARETVPSRSSSYEAGLSREFSRGVTLQPAIRVAHTDDPLVRQAPFARAEATLGIVVPLGYNRGGELTRAAEQAAVIGERISRDRYRQVVGDQVRDVIGAYWEYRAAYERLEVHLDSESRAVRLLEETRTLVAADERPAADLNPLQASVASKRVARMGSEQALDAARRWLGLAMGLAADGIAALPPPGDPFPAGTPFRADDATVRRLASAALARRPEVSLTAQQQRSADVLYQAARAGSRPRLDLNVGVGYAGLANSTDLGGAFSPLYEDVRGLNATVHLSYQAALSNRQAAGQEMQRLAAREQQRLAHHDQRERVISGVALAAAAVERSLAILEDAEAAVSLYEASVGNEKRKYELEVATLFDVLIAEDHLTSALLGGVEARLGHVLALLHLNVETGMLADDEGVVDPVTPDREVLTSP